GDFHITSGSPARGAGVALSPSFSDKDGNGRSGAWDIGAYVFGGSPSPTPSPTPVPSGPVYQQSAYAVPQNPPQNLNVTLPNPVQAHSLLVAVVGFNDATSSVSTLTDSEN